VGQVVDLEGRFVAVDGDMAAGTRDHGRVVDEQVDPPVLAPDPFGQGAHLGEPGEVGDLGPQ
jgi:hypothetical protein